MDIRRKIEIAEQAVRSISDHTDADSVVLLAALGRLKMSVEEKIADVTADVKRQAQEAVGPKA
jgi:hypothetical protein